MPRKALDGAKLAADIDRLEREDRTAPPTAQPSLMEAVRGLATYIETRARLGWTDPMIAVVLTSAGYPISAETLRSYRKRLRDEGLMAPLSVKGRQTNMRSRAVIPAGTAMPPTSKSEHSTDIVADVPVAAMPPATAVMPPTDEAAVARAPPDPAPTPSPARLFRVDRIKLPPDRA